MLSRTESKVRHKACPLCWSVISTQLTSLLALLWDQRPYPNIVLSSDVRPGYCATLRSQPSSRPQSRAFLSDQRPYSNMISTSNIRPDPCAGLWSQPSSQSHSSLYSEIQDLYPKPHPSSHISPGRCVGLRSLWKFTTSLEGLLWELRPYLKPDPSSDVRPDSCVGLRSQWKLTTSLQGLLWELRPYLKPDPSSNVRPDSCACLRSQPSSQHHSRPCSEIQDLIWNRMQAQTSALAAVLVWDLNQAHYITSGLALRSKTLSKTRSKLTHQPWTLCWSENSTKLATSLQALLWDPRPYPKPDQSSDVRPDNCAGLRSQPSSHSHSRPCSEIQDLIQNQIRAQWSGLITVLVWDLSQADNLTPGPALRSKTLSKTRSMLWCQAWQLCWSEIATKLTISLQALLWDPRPYSKQFPSSDVKPDHCAGLRSQPSSQSHSMPCSEIQDLIQNQSRVQMSALAKLTTSLQALLWDPRPIPKPYPSSDVRPDHCAGLRSQPRWQSHSRPCSEIPNLIQNQIQARTWSLCWSKMSTKLTTSVKALLWDPRHYLEPDPSSDVRPDHCAGLRSQPNQHCHSRPFSEIHYWSETGCKLRCQVWDPNQASRSKTFSKLDLISDLWLGLFSCIRFQSR